jgi:uncharacterized protein YndB with AHSA1/START domain
MSGATTPALYGECTVTLMRLFDAPRNVVWRAWTDPKHLAQWFGPEGLHQLGARTRRACRRVFAHCDAQRRRQ